MPHWIKSKDREDDWHVPGIGRVYRHLHGPSEGRWNWTCWTEGNRSAVQCVGTADTMEEAMQAVKRAHEALIEVETES